MVATPIRTQDFLASLGVDTHIAYTDGGYASIATVEADMSYLGIDNIRDGISNGAYGSAPLSSYIALAQHGAKFTFIVGAGGAFTTGSLQQQLSMFDQVDEAVPGSVVAVEGPNEINNAPVTYNGVGGEQGAIDLQTDLYSMVHADANLAGVTVDYFTGYDTVGNAAGPDPATTAGLADFDNQHPYPNFGQAPAFWVNPSFSLGNETAPYGPFVYTETGYSTNGGISGAVNADVQAKYSLDLFMDAASDGAAKTYLYQLLDAYQPGSRQGDDGYGLFDTSNNPKAAAVGLHNLVAILSSPAATGGPAPSASTAVNYFVANLPNTGSSLAMQKPDGTEEIVVWNEPPIWNEQTGTELTPASASVSVALGATYASVNVYDPLAGATPVATYSNVGSVPLTLGASPLIVEVGPTAIAATPQAPTSVTTPGQTPAVMLGSGPDILALSISEDPWQGNAEFTIDVDGVQIGGVQTATSLHSANADQVFDLSGNFAGAHTVSVDFINDAWGGSAASDRNLYVDGASVDTAIVPGAQLTLLSGGPQSFAFQGPVSGSSVGLPVVLLMSEDAWNGDAQFTVSANGVQIGGVQTETATHSDTVFSLGSLGSGTYDVAVDFLNDAWGGTPTTDRNLYVDGVAVGGVAQPGASLALYSGGIQHLSVVVPTH